MDHSCPFSYKLWCWLKEDKAVASESKYYISPLKFLNLALVCS